MEDPDALAQFLATGSRPVPAAPQPRNGAFAVLFVPALLAISLVPWVSPAAGRAPLSAAFLMLAMLLVWLAEQVAPREPGWNARVFSQGWAGWKRLGRDALYLFGIAQLSALAITSAQPALMSMLGALGTLPVWPTAAPFALKVLLAFFAVEFLSYWVHRAAHRSKLLWQFHSTHHVVTELNGLKAVRTHPVDNVVFYLGRTVPLLLLGAGAEELLAAAYFGGVLGILSHANLNLSDRVLGAVVNFPQYHAAHHSAELDESNSNFGCHTVLWDRVFRTFRKAPRAPLVLGVKPAGPRSLWQELAWPFYRRVS